MRTQNRNENKRIGLGIRTQNKNENKRIGLRMRTQNKNENYFNSLLGLLKK